jgi:hypothetical protein
MMAVRTDDRLLDAPMVPVNCRRCGAQVLARKSSWQQTSVQWDAESMATCPQRRGAEELRQHNRGPFLVCSELRDSIEDLARCGALPILDDAEEAAGRTGR